MTEGKWCAAGDVVTLCKSHDVGSLVSGCAVMKQEWAREKTKLSTVTALVGTHRESPAW